MMKPYWSVEWYTSENTTESRMQNANERKTTQQRVVRAVSVRARIAFSFCICFRCILFTFCCCCCEFRQHTVLLGNVVLFDVFFSFVVLLNAMMRMLYKSKPTAEICERARQSSHPMPLTTCRITTECTWIDDKSAKVFFYFFFAWKMLFPRLCLCLCAWSLIVNRFFPIHKYMGNWAGEAKKSRGKRQCSIVTVEKSYVCAPAFLVSMNFFGLV